MSITIDGPIDFAIVSSDVTLANAYLHSAYGKIVVNGINHRIARSGPVLCSEYYGSGYDNIWDYAYGECPSGDAKGIQRGRAYVPEPYNQITYSVVGFDNATAPGSDFSLHLGSGEWTNPFDKSTQKGEWKEINFDRAGVSESSTDSVTNGTCSYMKISYNDRMLYWWITSNGCDVPALHLSASYK